ncbi:MAG: alternative ribosome rescue aminoacyl-tRNA hydrolase ArfB [Dehalococcoidales bacterium]
MIEIGPNLKIDESEIEENFIQSSGPGGQNVNKVATAVQLRFDAAGSKSLPEEVRQRLISLSGNRVTEDGILLIESRRFRTQKRNREEAMSRLVRLIQRASETPRKRKKTRPTLSSIERRLESKRLRSRTKGARNPVKADSGLNT